MTLSYEDSAGTAGRRFFSGKALHSDHRTDRIRDEIVTCMGGMYPFVGIQIPISYGETFYELQFFAESICRMPLAKAVAFGSPTATYLGLSKTGYVVDDAVKERMHEMLKRVQSGEVVRDWNLEQLAGCPMLTRLRQDVVDHPIGDAEKMFFDRKEASGGI